MTCMNHARFQRILERLKFSWRVRENFQKKIKKPITTPPLRLAAYSSRGSTARHPSGRCLTILPKVASACPQGVRSVGGYNGGFIDGSESSNHRNQRNDRTPPEPSDNRDRDTSNNANPTDDVVSYR